MRRTAGMSDNAATLASVPPQNTAAKPRWAADQAEHWAGGAHRDVEEGQEIADRAAAHRRWARAVVASTPIEGKTREKPMPVSVAPARAISPGSGASQSTPCPTASITK